MLVLGAQSSSVALGTIAAVASIVGVIGALGAGFAIFRQKGVDAQLDYLTKSNTELRADAEYQKQQRSDERHECEKQIAELRGQVNVLRSDLVQSVIKSVTQAIRDLGVTLADAGDQGGKRGA